MVKINFSRTVQSAGVTVVGVMMTACAARSAPNPPVPPAQFERVVFEDTFDRYNPYWRQVRGQWAVADGRLLQAREDAREINAIYSTTRCRWRTPTSRQSRRSSPTCRDSRRWTTTTCSGPSA